MKSNFKIRILELCHKNWDKMTPDATGRFCLVCNKSVIDFTNKLPEEIQHFFENNQGQKICGRLKTSQLDLVSIKIPSILYPNTNYHKTFLLALSLLIGNNMHSQSSSGGTLNSNQSAQLEIEEKNQSEEYPKATNSITKITDYSSITMGPIESIYDRFPLSKNKNKKIVFESFSSQKQYVKTIFTKEEEEKTETKPYFPTGIKSFYAFFASEFKLPVNSELDYKFISFTVEKNGSLTYIGYDDISLSIQKEIIRVLKKSPKWIPGKSNGINKRMRGDGFRVSVYNEINTGK
ncbi:hypothetical protein [Flavobacterium chungangensis]|uniref:TonB C-terminal domain-containing protein n=1 Tax=Flavobacterium chungangensis TaxID=2708132 RepID=A0ABV8ZC44_9FLAO